MTAIGFLLQIPKPERDKLYQKEGFALTAMVWIVMTLFGAIPFVINGDIPSYFDACFEIMSDADKERLRSNTKLVEKLGATVETVFGDDVSYQIAEYARLSGVTKIVVGRSAATRKHPWSKPTLTEKLTAIAPNLDIHIIPDASADASYRPKQGGKN